MGLFIRPTAIIAVLCRTMLQFTWRVRSFLDRFLRGRNLIHSPCSPDLNPAEHIGNAVKRNIHEFLHQHNVDSTADLIRVTEMMCSYFGLHNSLLQSF